MLVSLGGLLAARLEACGIAGGPRGACGRLACGRGFVGPSMEVLHRHVAMHCCTGEPRGHASAARRSRTVGAAPHLRLVQHIPDRRLVRLRPGLELPLLAGALRLQVGLQAPAACARTSGPR